MNKKHLFKAATLIVFAIAVLASCNSGTSKKGLNIVYHERGTSDKSPQVNDYVLLDMIYRLQDTVIFDSHQLFEPLEIPVVEPSFDGDLYVALQQMKIGDSVTVSFPADSFFITMAGMPQLPDFVTAGEPIFFDIRLKSIKTPEEMMEEYKMYLEELRLQEPEVLEAYLDEYDIKVKPTASGLYYVEDKKGSGPNPQEGDVVTLHFSVSIIEGFPLYSSFDQEPLEMIYGEPFDTDGFEEGVGYMRKGGKAQFIVPSHLAFDSIGQGQIIPPYTTMLYEVEIVNILPKEEADKARAAANKAREADSEKARAEESTKIQNFIKDNNIVVQPSASGLYYIETEKGTGKKAANGKTVKVHYTLFNIEGRQLQSSKDFGQPFSFVLGQGQVIQGWDEGLLNMQEGGKARLLIPSSLAYGSTDRGEDIPAYSPLVFDVELIEVED